MGHTSRLFAHADRCLPSCWARVPQFRAWAIHPYLHPRGPFNRFIRATHALSSPCPDSAQPSPAQPSPPLHAAFSGAFTSRLFRAAAPGPLTSRSFWATSSAASSELFHLVPPSGYLFRPVSFGALSSLSTPGLTTSPSEADGPPFLPASLSPTYLIEGSVNGGQLPLTSSPTGASDLGELLLHASSMIGGSDVGSSLLPAISSLITLADSEGSDVEGSLHALFGGSDIGEQPLHASSLFGGSHAGASLGATSLLISGDSGSPPADIFSWVPTARLPLLTTENSSPLSLGYDVGSSPLLAFSPSDPPTAPKQPSAPLVGAHSSPLCSPTRSTAPLVGASAPLVGAHCSPSCSLIRVDDSTPPSDYFSPTVDPIPTIDSSPGRELPRSSARLLKLQREPVLRKAMRRKARLLGEGGSATGQWTYPKVKAKSRLCGVKLSDEEAKELGKLLRAKA